MKLKNIFLHKMLFQLTQLYYIRHAVVFILLYLLFFAAIYISVIVNSDSYNKEKK